MGSTATRLVIINIESRRLWWGSWDKEGSDGGHGQGTDVGRATFSVLRQFTGILIRYKDGKSVDSPGIPPTYLNLIQLVFLMR